jgi:hypothetical protein
MLDFLVGAAIEPAASGRDRSMAKDRPQAPPQAPVNVICMKWGTKYGPEYVNRLHRGVAKRLRRRHRFVCFTDAPAGIDQAVEIRPLPKLGLPPGPERGWMKIATFADTLADLSGTTLFLDLDVIVVGGLDAFFDPPGAFHIMQDFNPKRPGVGNSSVYRFEVGAYPNVLRDLVADFETIKRRYRNEQEYLTAAMRRLSVLQYWPADWAVSYKKRCIPPFPVSLWRAPACPAEARIIVFHGHPKPEEAMVGTGNKWYRPALPAPWIREAWFGAEESAAG